MHRLLRQGLSAASLIVALGACERTATAPPEPMPTARPEVLRPEVPALPEATEHAHDGVTTVSRLMVSTITPTDGVTFLLERRPASKPATLPQDQKSMRLRLILTPLDGGPIELEARAKRFGPLLRLDGLGVIGDSWMAGWEQPRPELLAPGRYRVRLLGLRGDDVDVDTGEHALEVVRASDEVRPLSELAQLARRAALHPVLADRVQVLALETLEDRARNRWLRFSYPGPNEDMTVEVLMTPAGKMLAYDERTFFTCLAEGSLVATPEGSVPIERLRPGDQVHAYDLTRSRPVLTTVEHVVSRGLAPVRSIDGLRVTDHHPVFADGAWQPASALHPGDLVRGVRGARALSLQEPSPRPVPVYDVAVAWPHNLFVDDVLVHNKAAPQALPMTRFAWISDRPTYPGWKKKY